jgi:hypothetical protein
MARSELDDLPASASRSIPGIGTYRIGVIRVIEDQITTLRPYNARYTGDHRSFFSVRYVEMITRISLVMQRGGGATDGESDYFP